MLVAALSMISSAAFAQDKRSDSCAEQRKRDPKAVCKLDIEGSTLDGERISPDGERILAHPPALFGSLIRYRMSMINKMAKDVDRF